MNYDAEIYTDGACLGNPGPGGYGAVIMENDNRVELSGGFRKTTNNRMELLAVIAALKYFAGRKGLRLKIHSDSKLIINAFNQHWIKAWKRRGWKKADGDTVLNKDLWQELAKLEEQHYVTFEWVKGHAGIEENERCDELSKAAAIQDELLPDPAYDGGKGKSIIRFAEEEAAEALKTTTLASEILSGKYQDISFAVKEDNNSDKWLEISDKNPAAASAIKLSAADVDEILELLGRMKDKL